jgi:hypothetical protein
MSADAWLPSTTVGESRDGDWPPACFGPKLAAATEVARPITDNREDVRMMVYDLNDCRDLSLEEQNFRAT